jgi:hypothetical protein
LPGYRNFILLVLFNFTFILGVSHEVDSYGITRVALSPNLTKEIDDGKYLVE